MEFVVVEPRNGDELDRLITALVNVTGVIHQLLLDVREGFDGDGVELIGEAAERMHAMFCVIAEQWDDEELAEVTGLLAWMTLLIADDLGLRDHFDPEHDPFEQA